MSIDLITLWHQRARPNPTNQNLSVQTGCHFEEVGEMLEAMANTDPLIEQAHDAVVKLAEALKSGLIQVGIRDRQEFLDAMADQIVTGTGVAHCAGMNVTEACRRVNASNWSKYDNDGQPIFKASGKIDKGPNYVEPDLTGLY